MISKEICSHCNGECYVDDEPCVECEAGFIDEIGPEDYNTYYDDAYTKLYHSIIERSNDDK